ncbi:hypothetical protein SLEP1_g48076 [Rubroshorea leprosula]|uniref:Uncharacterized protein n=1 Tax=Rubroshorea leprosula TaxID=152421 RepID=A0AAV5LVB3_9ROSI|nr:hypothetical protein SLEP1_g48076 [Rubroshorea leprosula]
MEEAIVQFFCQKANNKTTGDKFIGNQIAPMLEF